MRIRDEYLHGSDQTGVVKKIEVTIGTGNNANKSVIKYIKADSEGGIVEVPIGDITGKAATASKLDNTSAIGSKTNPVYFTEKGVPSACTYSLNATVPVGAANKVLYYSAPNTLDVQSYATLTSNLDVFTVATASAAGKKGLVPAPAANQLGAGNFFLRADGVWTVIESKSAAQNGIATSLVTTGEKYNWNSAYNWYNSMTSGDTDGIINKWKEVEAFLANYGDSSTLAAELAKLVTLSTDQTITGVKTFSEVINGSITGNAGTADKLKNTVNINGVAFDGSADITITAVATGGNSDTVGGYSPSDFLLKAEHETFESIIATALTDLDNRKIEASDIPTSLPANGGNADYATSASDADTLDGYHEYSFLRYRGETSTDQEETLWNQIGIKEYHKALPDGMPSGIYPYGQVISFAAPQARFEIWCSHISSDFSELFYRSGWGDDRRVWRKFIDSGNIGSQSVNYATSAGNADTATKLQTARTIWGQSFDGTSNITLPPSFPSIINLNRNPQTGEIIDSSKLGFELETYANDTRLKTYSASGIANYTHLVLASSGNVGISTASPSSKLHVVGDIYTTTGFKKEGSNDNYVLLGGGGHKEESSLSVNYATSSESATKSDYLTTRSIGSIGDTVAQIKQKILDSYTSLAGKQGYSIEVPLQFMIGYAQDDYVISTGGNYYLTYLAPGYDGKSYGQWLATCLGSERLYVFGRSNNQWTERKTIAWTSDIPTDVSAFYNDKGYLTSHAYSYGSIDIYDVNGAKKTSNNTVSASVNTETLRLQEGANIAITATNSGTSGSDNIKIAVTGITSNIDRNGYGQLALQYNGASGRSAILQSVTYNEILTVKAGSGIDFNGHNDDVANNDVWTISAIPYNCAITLNTNSTKSLIKDTWSADKDSVYLTSNGTASGTFLDAGTYALWIEDRSSDSGTPNYYSGTFTCAGSATAGRLDEIALHSSMATIADTNAPTRIFVATQISSDSSNTPGKHVLRFCSQDSKATPHYLTVKVNRII